MPSSSVLARCVPALVWTLVGCGASVDEVTPSVQPDASALIDAAPTLSATCATSATRACTCNGAAGVETCVSGQWGACYCAPPPVTVDRTGECVAGVYQGDFTGLAGTPVPLFPVAGLSLEGGPPLTITLSRDGGGEFTLIGNGTLSGSANGLFNFRAEITGTLDCATKSFTGMLAGSAEDIFGVFIHQRFTGNMTADYDAQAKALVNGKWDLMSTDANPVDGGPTLAPTDVTGSGDWDGRLRDGGAADAAGASP